MKRICMATRSFMMICFSMSFFAFGVEQDSFNRPSSLPGACFGSKALNDVTPNPANLLDALVKKPANIDRLIVFGDSLSDTGNLQRFSNLGPLKTLLLPSCVYWQGRFSNGPIWLDYLSSSLSSGFANYAVGGAQTNEPPLSEMTGLNGFFARLTPAYWAERISRSWIRSLSEQIDSHLDSLIEMPSPDDLVFIWIGANNYLNDGMLVQNKDGKPNLIEAQKLIGHTIDDIEAAILKLNHLGYRKFAVASIPELAGLPVNPSDPDPVTNSTYYYLTRQHNKALQAMIERVQTEHKGIQLARLRAFSINQKTIENPSEYGFSDITNPCYKGSLFGPFKPGKTYCHDSYGVKLWDWVHPNTKMHCFYANQFLKDISLDHLLDDYDESAGLKLCMGLSL